MKRIFPMKRTFLTLALAALLTLALTPAIASAAPAVHVTTHFKLTPGTPNVMKLDQRVSVTCTYVSPEPTGVRIFMRPMTGGVPTANYAAHPSPIYPAGTGAADGWFTITKGNVTVDHIRIQVYNAAQTVMLDEVLIPVNYRFTSATANVLSRLTMTATPNVLQHKQRVSLSFKYRTTNKAGVRIFVRPLTGSALTPNYAAHASPLYPVGSGTAKGWFTVTKGTPTVSKVRLTMWNANQTRLLFKAVVPVHFQYKKPANVVRSITLTPANPNVLRLGQNLALTFKYATTDAGGVRIFARPMTGGAATPNYAAHPSPLYPTGAGSADGWFTIENVGATVDEIHIWMTNADQTVTLFDTEIPVSFQFK